MCERNDTETKQRPEDFDDGKLLRVPPRKAMKRAAPRIRKLESRRA